MAKNGTSRAGQNNRSNQMNPNNAAYRSSREGSVISPAPHNRSDTPAPIDTPTQKDDGPGTTEPK